MAIGQELLNVPMGDMIRQMAFAIAEGQAQLDATAIDVAEMMGGLKVVYDEEGTPSFDDSRVFFGHEWMSLKEAEAYIATDIGFSGDDAKAMMDRIKAINNIDTAAADTTLVRVPVRLSMLELGFTPTFYQFVDTIIEVKIAIKITREIERSRTQGNTLHRNTLRAATRGGFMSFLRGNAASASLGANVITSQVDASYSAKYSYSAEGASLLRTKLVPVPPPPVLEERVRRMMEEEAERRRKKLKEDFDS